MSARISVIIPVYNGGRFILDALSSVCAQTYLPTEIVVADDASTDNTRDLVTEFARAAPVPIKLFSMEKNTGGPSRPINEAFRRTTGDYVTVLDADDCFAPEAFATYVAMYEVDPTAKVGLAATDLMMFEDRTGRIIMPSSFARWPELLGPVLTDNSPVGVLLSRDQAVRAVALGFAIPFRGLIAREAWEAIGGLNPKYHITNDCDFTWRLVAESDFRVRLLNRTLNRVRSSPGTLSSREIDMDRQLVGLYRDMLAVIRDPDVRVQLRRQLRKKLFGIAYQSYKDRRYGTLFPAMCALGVERLRTAILPD